MYPSSLIPTDFCLQNFILVSDVESEPALVGTSLKLSVVEENVSKKEKTLLAVALLSLSCR